MVPEDKALYSVSHEKCNSSGGDAKCNTSQKS